MGCARLAEMGSPRRSVGAYSPGDQTDCDAAVDHQWDRDAVPGILQRGESVKQDEMRYLTCNGEIKVEDPMFTKVLGGGNVTFAFGSAGIVLAQVFPDTGVNSVMLDSKGAQQLAEAITKWFARLDTDPREV